MKLHHYTTPAGFDAITERGLEPQSTYPGRTEPVTYAFLTEATMWPRGVPIDDIWSMNVLKGIIWSIGRGEREGPEGLVHLTFEAPDNTIVHDRAQIQTSDEAYQASGVALENRAWDRYERPEAVIRTATPRDKITVIETLNRDEVRALFREYSQDIPTTF